MPATSHKNNPNSSTRSSVTRRQGHTMHTVEKFTSSTLGEGHLWRLSLYVTLAKEMKSRNSKKQERDKRERGCCCFIYFICIYRQYSIYDNRPVRSDVVGACINVTLSFANGNESCKMSLLV